MATAHVNREWREVTTKKKVRVGVTLDLTNEEAVTLRSILRCVGGDPQTSARRYTNRITEALEMAHIPWNTSCLMGGITWFKTSTGIEETVRELEED